MKTNEAQEHELVLYLTNSEKVGLPLGGFQLAPLAEEGSQVEVARPGFPKSIRIAWGRWRLRWNQGTLAHNRTVCDGCR